MRSASPRSPQPPQRPQPSQPPTDAAQPQASARGRIPARIVLLVAGDLVSFLVFAGVGRQSHGEASGLAAIGHIAAVAFPFALGWFLVAPFVGAFRRATTRSPRAMLARTELSWLCAWPVTLLLRWICSADHRVPVSFAIVILLANALFLGIWRTAFALVERRAH